MGGHALRFDDTLETVLAADLSTPYGAQSAWRQIVDLIGRRRAAASSRAMGVLRTIRESVPMPVRAASARALEFADPPPQLVRLFALDELQVALPVLRSARMSSAEWVQLLPELAPGGRAVLRNRRDLSPAVRRALESFGPIDFVLPDETAKSVSIEEIRIDWAAAFEASATDSAIEETAAVEPELAELALAGVEDSEAAGEPIAYQADSASISLREASLSTLLARLPEVAPAPEPFAEPLPSAAEEADATSEDPSSVALTASAPSVDAEAAQEPEASEIPVRPVQSGTGESVGSGDAIAPAEGGAQASAMEHDDSLVAEVRQIAAEAVGDDGGTFEIADVVARIDAFWRHREESGPPQPVAPRPADDFRFETDAKGLIRWVDGVSRAPLIGVALDSQLTPGAPDMSRVDGIAAGAFRRRAGFSNARLSVEGESDAAGDWLISAIPVFDPGNGRFTGYRGTARRPRVDERAEPVRGLAGPAMPADSLRQLVHELRTPTNAIAGFAEMIEAQMLGPVVDPYRDRAQIIRSQARELLGAIDDLDLAARIDSAALSLVPGEVALRPVLTGIADDLAPLAELRGSVIALPIADLSVTGDRRAVERLLARLLATLVSASGQGERIGVHVGAEGTDMVAITIDRPQALADYPGDSVLDIDDEREDITLLGTGFALRLSRNLARELGGALVIGRESLTLRLPAAVNTQVGQAHLN